MNPPLNPRPNSSPTHQPITLQDLEKIRLDYLITRKIVGIFFTISIIVLVILTILSAIYAFTFLSSPTPHPQQAPPAKTILEVFIIITICTLCLSSIATVVSLYIHSPYTLKYRLAYKSYYIAGTLAQIFDHAIHYHDKGIPEQTLLQTNMIYTGDTYSSEDYISGSYKGISFEQSDVFIREHITRDEPSCITLFSGRWLIFDFPRKFHFKMAVVGKNFKASRISPREALTVESPEFNKMYRVFAQDGTEAFYLLPPDIISALEALGKKHHKNIFLAFLDNKLHIAIGGLDDSLEPPSPKKPIDPQREFVKVTEDLQLITRIIDSLKLDH